MRCFFRPWLLLLLGGAGASCANGALEESRRHTPNAGGGSAGSSGSAGTAGSTGVPSAAGSAGTAGGAGVSAGAGAGGAAGSDGAGGNSVGTITIGGFATWKGGATAAYTIIHDDLCDPLLDGLFDTVEPELSSRGLRAGFGAIVGVCENRGIWAQVQALLDHGHEIVCHSWTHAHLDVARAPAEQAPLDLDLELHEATYDLDQRLVGQKTSYFIFPFDEFTDGLIAELQVLGYIGARAGERGLNAPDFADAMRNEFDVWGSSVYADGPAGLQEYVDDAIDNGGWANREFHAVGDQAWMPIGLEDYRAHLDYVEAKIAAGALWMDTPSAVVRYRFARELCGTPSAVAGSITFAGAAPSCSQYATELTLEITTSVDATTLLAKQAGALLTTHKLGPNHFAIEVDPSRGVTYVGGL